VSNKCTCGQLGPLSLRSGDICLFCERQEIENNSTIGAGVSSKSYTRDVAIATIEMQQARGATSRCLKCRHVSGDNWEQCEGTCPMPGSPHYDDLTAHAFQRIPLPRE
jgi:hypothetical protein